MTVHAAKGATVEAFSPLLTLALNVPDRVLRIAVAIGAVVDAGVAILALFFQPLLGPLLDVPRKTPRSRRSRAASTSSSR